MLSWGLTGCWKTENLSFPVFWFDRGRVILLKRKDDRRKTKRIHINNVIHVLNGILVRLGKQPEESRARESSNSGNNSGRDEA